MSFLKPLSKIEERFYLKQLKEGNLEAKIILIEHNMRLVTKIANQFKNMSLDVDDLISIGKIGLIKALDSFDQNKGVKFSTFAFRCISNEFLMVYEKLMKEMVKKRFYKCQDDQEYQFLINNLEDEQINIEEMYLKSEAYQELYETLNKLDALARTILVLRFGLYDYQIHTQMEIANELNVSRSYIAKLEKDALKKARIIANQTSKIKDNNFKKPEIILNGIKVKGHFKMRDTKEELNWLKDKIKQVDDREIFLLLKKGFLKEEIAIFYFIVFSDELITDQALISLLELDFNLLNQFRESLFNRFYEAFKIDLNCLIIDSNSDLSLEAIYYQIKNLERFNKEYCNRVTNKEPRESFKLLIRNYLKEMNKGKTYILWQPKSKLIKK